MRIDDLIKQHARVLTVILEDDLEYYLKSRFDLTKEDFTPAQWALLSGYVRLNMRHSLKYYEAFWQRFHEEIIRLHRTSCRLRENQPLQPNSIVRVIDGARV